MLPDAVRYSEQQLVASLLLLVALLGVFAAYHVATGLAGFGWLRAMRRASRRLAPAPRRPRQPLVTFVITAYREGELVAESIRSILAQRYPADRLRVVAVVDEDEEGTAEALLALALEDPAATRHRNAEGDDVVVATRVTAIVQSGERGGRGKPRALQNASRYVPDEGLVGILDADHLLDPDFVEKCVPRFADPRVGMVQGHRYPAKAPRGFVARWDVLEQNVGQIQFLLARDRIGAASFYGSTALMRADLIRAIGWEDCLAEDTLLHYEVRSRGYRVAYEARTGSRETHVTTLAAFVPQRRRWAGGHMQVLYSRFLAERGATRGVLDRLDRILHLHYYSATLLLLSYWLLRAIHYWSQEPPAPLRAVTLASAFVGLAAFSFERNLGARGRPFSGAVVATLLAFSLVSLVASWIVPAPRAPPLHPLVDVALFLAPAFLVACGYANPLVRPPARLRDHAKNLGVLAAGAVLMILVTLYANLTGIPTSLRKTTREWHKTLRTDSKVTTWTRSS